MLMQRKNKIHWITVSLAFILVLGSVSFLSDFNNSDYESTVIIPELERRAIFSGAPHVPIVIDGDSNFKDTAFIEGWLGNGLPQNPYIIDGLDIDLAATPGHCISISNTQAHFVIRNSNLTGASVNPGAGIYLNNVTNGLLINNTCTSNNYGIYLEDSLFNTVSDNIYNNNYRGFYLFLSYFNTVMNNTCTSNTNIGTLLISSNSNTLNNNTFKNNYQGICFFVSSSNTVVNNTFNNNNIGITLESSSNNDINWNDFTDNSLSVEDDEYNIFDYNYWSDYTGTDVNQDGIGDTPYTITGSAGSQDSHPLMYQPTIRWIEPPMNQSVEFEYLFHYELKLEQYGPLGLLSWSISDSIHFSFNEGVVESKVVLPKGVYALRVRVTNIYGRCITGLFYVHVTVDASKAPKWLTIPTDQSLAYDEKFDCQVMVMDPSGIDHWELNDTVHFKLTEWHYAEGCTARITNGTFLAPGAYGLSIDVFDTYGNKLSAVITISVDLPEPDTTIPDGVDPVMTLVLGTGIGGAMVLVLVVVFLRRKS